jgi:hypothetical protein
MKEELLNEEETLKLLKVNKAQLENYVREGKLAPLYQESVRKFKLSEISKITVEPSASPVTPIKEEPSFIKTQQEGSTRVVEPPKETTKIGITRTGSKGSTFEAAQGTEQFLKQLEKAPQHNQGSLTAILLIVTLAISAFSVFMLTFTLQGKELPQFNKILSSIGAILPIDKEESAKIEDATNSIIRSAQQTKSKAEALIKETGEFISLKD